MTEIFCHEQRERTECIHTIVYHVTKMLLFIFIMLLKQLHVHVHVLAKCLCSSVKSVNTNSVYFPSAGMIYVA